MLRSDPDIGSSSLAYQLEQLIVRPLRATGVHFPHCVIIIDALDECKDDSTISVVLASLSLYISEFPSLRILITSRPEKNIAHGFKSGNLEPATRQLVLHEVELDVMQNDIEHYLTVSLAATRDYYHLADSWPSSKNIHALSSLSSGLFIFAATSIRFIEDRKYSDPEYQIIQLLNNTVTAEEQSSPRHHLDLLYTQVLTHAFPSMSAHLANRLRMIIGSIVLLQDPLAPLDLEHLIFEGTEATRGPPSLCSHCPGQ